MCCCIGVFVVPLRVPPPDDLECCNATRNSARILDLWIWREKEDQDLIRTKTSYNASLQEA